jgi:hypothetical protein
LREDVVGIAATLARPALEVCAQHAALAPAHLGTEALRLR